MTKVKKQIVRQEKHKSPGTHVGSIDDLIRILKEKCAGGVVYQLSFTMYEDGTAYNDIRIITKD